MYEDTYTIYDSKDFEYSKYPVPEIKCEAPYYEWDYGDTFDLKFDIIRQVEKLPDYYDFVNIYIYNFRHDLIYKSENISIIGKCKCQKISIYVDPELSSKLIKGNYYCKVVAVGQIFGGKYTQTTIIHPSDCILHVR